jgi:hypothetical protein
VLLTRNVGAGFEFGMLVMKAVQDFLGEKTQERKEGRVYMEESLSRRYFRFSKK